MESFESSLTLSNLNKINQFQNYNNNNNKNRIYYQKFKRKKKSQKIFIQNQNTTFNYYYIKRQLKTNS